MKLMRCGVSFIYTAAFRAWSRLIWLVNHLNISLENMATFSGEIICWTNRMAMLKTIHILRCHLQAGQSFRQIKFGTKISLGVCRKLIASADKQTANYLAAARKWQLCRN